MLSNTLVDIIQSVSLYNCTPVILSSGLTSSYYFDIKKTLLSPNGIPLISQSILTIMGQREIRLVGGLESGAIPIITGIVLLSSLIGGPTVSGLFVRKQAKQYGIDKIIEGASFNINDEILVVEDVTTTGSSSLQVVNILREAGALVRTIVTVVDRLEGARDACIKEGVELISLTDVSHYDIHTP